MNGLTKLRAIEVVLTSSCNLSCGYCYQNAKKPQRMSWKTLRAALGLILDSPQEEVEILFLGGEPLLELPLMRRASAFLRKNGPAGKKVRMRIVTNGLLLDPSAAAFLARNEVDTRISFDGIAAAQDGRGSNTFHLLDRMLDRLRSKHPDFFTRHLTVCITFTPDSICHLPASIDYLLAREVPGIIISPSLTADADWRIDRIGEMDLAFEKVFAGSLRYWQVKGEVPVRMFQKTGNGPSPKGSQGQDCGFLHGLSLTVDADGQMYGCTLLVDSYQHYPAQPLIAQGAAMRMGSIFEPGLSERHAAFLEAVRKSEMFCRKEEKYSAYGRCRACGHLAECTLCLGSCRYVPGNADPHRISDFVCAFHRVSLKYRALFPDQPGPLELIRGTEAMHTEMQRWLALAKAVREE